MNLGLAGRQAVVVDRGATPTAAACIETLRAEGATVLDPGEAERADIIVAVAPSQPGSDVLELELDELQGAWDGVVEAIAAYREALPRMREQGWGRFVWVGTAAAQSLDAAGVDDLDTVTTLAMRALHKVIAFDEGPANVLPNAVLRGSAATDADVADAVAFLCSDGAGYLTGVTLTIDGGAGSAMF